MAKQYFVKPIRTDEELTKLEGTFIDKFDLLIDHDADVYSIQPDGEKKLLFIFRKGLIPDKLMKKAITTFKADAKKAATSRGVSTGKISRDFIAHSDVFVDVLNPNSFKSRLVYKDGSVSDYYVSNRVSSMIAGYFDKPKLSEKHDVFSHGKIPCRTTLFTEKNTEKWQEVLPLINKADSLYKKYLPERHSEQYNIAKLTPDFQIEDTAFSTVTVNYNWRTAVHTDSGDYRNGYSVILVATEGEYTGGYLGYPKYGVCVDVRNGDFLLKDPHQYHGNTPIVGVTEDYTRLSMILYYREKIHKCARNSVNVKEHINVKELVNVKEKTYNEITFSPTKFGLSGNMNIYIRPETTDEKVVDEVLKKRVYIRQNIGFTQERGEKWLDLGGNIGTFAMSALAVGCQVTCYEPEMENAKLLKMNLERNFPNGSWNIVRSAVGLENGFTDLYVCNGDYNKYRHTLYHKRGRSSVKVPIERFHDVMNRLKPDGVKIDIEGTEIDIFESVSADDWNKWGTKKLCFEYSFDIDPSIPRFIRIVNELKKYFNIVNYTKVKEDELEYKYFPAACMCYCIKTGKS